MNAKPVSLHAMPILPLLPWNSLLSFSFLSFHERWQQQAPLPAAAAALSLGLVKAVVVLIRTSCGGPELCRPTITTTSRMTVRRPSKEKREEEDYLGHSGKAPVTLSRAQKSREKEENRCYYSMRIVPPPVLLQ